MNSGARQLPAQLQRAVAFHRQGQLARARAIYEEILAAHPQHFDALHMLGVVAIQTRNPRLAVELIGKAIQLVSESAEAHSNLGSALEALGLWDAALASYDHAVSIRPDYGEAHFNRGNALNELKQYNSALDSYARAIALKENFALAHFNQGNVLRKLRRLDAARASYDRAIAIAPEYAEALSNRGLVLKELGDLQAALANYDRAIAIKPNYAEAHCNRGNVLKELKLWDAALASYNQAIKIKAGFAEAYFNRGVLLYELGLYEPALSSYDQALSLQPDHAEAHSNRGNAFKELNRLHEALAGYEQAIAIKPDYAEAHFNRSIVLLLAGHLEQGWIDYEWRWKNEAGSVIKERREFAQPLWLGEESPVGKTLLLHGEQGLGDTIQFCRYAKLAADLKARVILEVKAPLVHLLAGLEGVSLLVARGSALPHFDYQCPLLSLPLAFKTNLDNIPLATGYLRANPHRVAHWRDRLGDRNKPNVGLVWSGNARQRNDPKRSVPLAVMMSHLPSEFQYVCLQTEVREADRQTLLANANILYFGSELNFENTAALCECLDLVISVDTSVAHLSAALSRRTWILLPYNPDWRWLLDRSDSPWYRSVTLFRQTTLGDWNGVFRRVTENLRGLFDSWSPRACGGTD
jgi:tetratricopeptide (TPR) repeat protein